ncbi:MAG: hypothetical protein FD177_1169 [Desulfovibrionaceae bacterium]|nr:MAG: hypothetical protein FD177_1169 [Desulfovibrionaceae bacterium]
MVCHIDKEYLLPDTAYEQVRLGPDAKVGGLIQRHLENIRTGQFVTGA